MKWRLRQWARTELLRRAMARTRTWTVGARPHTATPADVGAGLPKGPVLAVWHDRS